MSLSGVLLLNLGTPDHPDVKSVRRYLKEFLMDPFVIDIPFVFRWMLVNLTILPRRPKISAEAYQKIWTSRGSPLFFHLLDLQSKVQKLLGDSIRVESAMRYGNPSVQKAFEDFKKAGITRVQVLPLYPQYSLAATESSIHFCKKLARKAGLQLEFLPDFYDHPLFIDSFVQQIQETLKGYSYQHVLFSFHGLPERHVKKTSSNCFLENHCCDAITESNKNCYRAQSFVSARKMAEKLNLKKQDYTVCFQSRLGRTPWIRPYTDHFYQSLPQQGIKNLAVVCPAFVADCLETLEEIEIRGREDWIKNGGNELKLVPSLNSSDFWASAVAQMVRESKVR